RFELPALQRQPCLEALFQVVVVARAFVERDGATGFCLILACLLCHAAIVPRRAGALTCPPAHDGNPRCPRSTAAHSSNIPLHACSSWSTTWRPIHAGLPGARVPR